MTYLGKTYALTDIAMDGSGQMWGVDSYSLFKVNETTAILTRVGSLGAGPAYGSNALGVDSSGNMYLASTASTIYSRSIQQRGWPRLLAIRVSIPLEILRFQRPVVLDNCHKTQCRRHGGERFGPSLPFLGYR